MNILNGCAAVSAGSAVHWFNAAEAGLRDLTERMLAAVSAKFGRASNEYEQAGGKRKSDRKRAVRATATPPVTKAA